mmetsp:Transcript_10431/g.24151  ORF Transcript_10431/g.24151 Transcript_10431/m.24151 type:complete len:96 (-) Transcript_10431:33-320(-)
MIQPQAQLSGPVTAAAREKEGDGKLRWKSNVDGWDQDDSGRTWKAAAMWHGHRCIWQLNDVIFFNGCQEAQAQLKTLLERRIHSEKYDIVMNRRG